MGNFLAQGNASEYVLNSIPHLGQAMIPLHALPPFLAQLAVEQFYLEGNGKRDKMKVIIHTPHLISYYFQVYINQFTWEGVLTV